MADLFKKLLYTGVGLVTTTAEKLQNNVNELVDRGSITKEEGRKVFDELMDTTEAKKEEFEGKLKDVVTNVMKSLNLPTKGEFDSLIERLDALEAKIGTPAKKRTTRAKKAANTRAKKATAAVKKTATRAKKTATRTTGKAKATATKTTKAATTKAKSTTAAAKRTATKTVKKATAKVETAVKA